MATTKGPPILRLDQWVVEVSRTWAEEAGQNVPGNGPWVTVGVFNDEAPARAVVEEFTGLFPGKNLAKIIQVRSGAQVFADRGTGLPTQPWPES